jgi:5-methylcytosine-specific restriction endonuclease McrA
LIPSKSEEKAARAAEYREFYAQHQQEELARHAAWKAANPELVNEQHRIRQERIEATDDGTLTAPAIRSLKARTSQCAYCNSPLLDPSEKQTDHMIALCHGGEHSRRNILIVCRGCNARKASLTYEQWVERIEPQHRARVQSLYLERYAERAA